MRISDWSSDVCSSDLRAHVRQAARAGPRPPAASAHRAGAGRLFFRYQAGLAAGQRAGRPPGRAARRSGLRHRGHLAGVAAERREDRKSVAQVKRGLVREAVGGGRSIKKTNVTANDCISHKLTRTRYTTYRYQYTSKN